MSHWNTSAIEIDKKLRDDFRRRMRDYGISSDFTDPILSILFRTFAHQLEVLYSDTDRIRLSLLDELTNNLGFGRRTARPAQTVVHFNFAQGSEVIAAGTELVGEAASGERITFATDASTTVSGAHIAFAATYQEGKLQLLSAVDLPDALMAQRPSPDPVSVNLGAAPAIFLAIDNLPAQHLSRMGLFLDLAPEDSLIRQGLQREAWCLVGPDGDLNAGGILIPKQTNAGVQQLDWLVQKSATPDNTDDVRELPTLAAGFYGSRVLLFPEIPAERRSTCAVPRGMEQALRKMFAGSTQELFRKQRAWLRVSVPTGIPSLQHSIRNIILNTITASNVECVNQTIWFEMQGTCIPVAQAAGGSAGHLVAPLSIVGESGECYLAEHEPETQKGSGRFALRNGRIELNPGISREGQSDRYANVRLWMTNGTLGNRVGSGQITALINSRDVKSRFSNLTPAAGGCDAPQEGSTKARLAARLLSRDRIVTRRDLLNEVRAYDQRIVTADVTPGVMRTEIGLQRVQQLTVHVARDKFVDPKEEIEILAADLHQHLADRFPYGTRLSLTVV